MSIFILDESVGDKRFAVGDIERVISAHATAPVIMGEIPPQMILRSKANPYQFFPTGQCFDDAMDFIDGVINYNKGKARAVKPWILAHGILRHEGTDFAHAWVESGAHIYEGRQYRGDRVFARHMKGAWYKLWDVQYTQKYNIPQALAKMKGADSAGPWDMRITERALAHGQ